MCEKVEGGVAEWRNIVRERKVSFVASIIIIMIIWGGFIAAVTTL